MKKDLRDKVFSIILLIFSIIYPLMLFFDVYEYKHKEIDGDTITKVVDRYNLINIKDISTFMLVFSLVFIVLSLTVAVFTILEIRKNNYYSLKYRIIFSIYTVVSATFGFYASFFILSMLFMIIAAHMFLIYYDIKRNKRKLSNALIYAITYVMFMVMMIISFGALPK